MISIEKYGCATPCIDLDRIGVLRSVGFAVAAVMAVPREVDPAAGILDPGFAHLVEEDLRTGGTESGISHEYPGELAQPRRLYDYVRIDQTHLIHTVEVGKGEVVCSESGVAGIPDEAYSGMAGGQAVYRTIRRRIVDDHDLESFLRPVQPVERVEATVK